MSVSDRESGGVCSVCVCVFVVCVKKIYIEKGREVERERAKMSISVAEILKFASKGKGVAAQIGFIYFFKRKRKKYFFK